MGMRLRDPVEEPTSSIGVIKLNDLHRVDCVAYCRVRYRIKTTTWLIFNDSLERANPAGWLSGCEKAPQNLPPRRPPPQSQKDIARKFRGQALYRWPAVVVLITCYEIVAFKVKKGLAEPSPGLQERAPEVEAGG